MSGWKGRLHLEHSGQKEEALETKSPQAKVISDAQISQCEDQVAEIMNLILAISCSSQLGAPLVVQPRPLLGGSVKTEGHGEGKDGLHPQFLLSAAHLPARGEARKSSQAVATWKHPWHFSTLGSWKAEKIGFSFFASSKVIFWIIENGQLLNVYYKPGLKLNPFFTLTSLIPVTTLWAK